MKSVLRDKFVALSAYIKKREMSKIEDLMIHFEDLGKQEQTKPRLSRRQEIVIIRAEINKIETKRYKRSTKSWFFEKNKIDKPVARLIRTKRKNSNK